jgi:SAM-dependent methyltransferase
MPNETTNCFDGRRAYGQVRTWSEDPLTTRARAIWSEGDVLPIARSYANDAEQFVSRLAIRPGESVLDVGCGAGNLAIPAARAGGRVKGIDIAPYVIAEARLEARAAGFSIDFDVGDAESLPFVDHQFDTTVTMFGARNFPSGRAAATGSRDRAAAGDGELTPRDSYRSPRPRIVDPAAPGCAKSTGLGQGRGGAGAFR